MALQKLFEGSRGSFMVERLAKIMKDLEGNFIRWTIQVRPTSKSAGTAIVVRLVSFVVTAN